MPWSAALSSALPAGTVMTTRCATPSLRTAAIAGVSSEGFSTGSMVGIMADGPARRAGWRSALWRRFLRARLVPITDGVVPAVAIGEGLHQPAQQAMQLLPFRGGED